MLKKIKFISLVMVLVLLAGLASCAKSPSGNDTPTKTTDNQNQATGSYTEKETGANGEPANLIAENYRIVWGSQDREDCITMGGQNFHQRVLSEAKVNLKSVSDTSVEANGYEIIIGTTTRAENVDVSTLSYYDYGWSFKTSNVVIYGGSADALENAVNRFFEKYWDDTAKELSVPFGCTFTATYHYPYTGDTITVNGNAIRNMTIVYEKAFSAEATEVYYGFGRLTGVRLNMAIYKSAEQISENTILVGVKNPKNLGGVYEISDGCLSFGENDGNVKELNNLSSLVSLFFNSEFPAEKSSVELSQIKKKEVYPTVDKMIYAEPSSLEELDRNFEIAKESLLATESQWRVSGNGKVYYVSPNGNDANDGMSAERAWKSVEKVNSFRFTEGSVVLFERGGVWNRQGSLNLQKGVTYSAYGTGDKPMFSNYIDAGKASDWISVGDGLWVYGGSYRSVDVDGKENDTTIPGSYIVSTNKDNADNDDVANIVVNNGKGYGAKVTKYLKSDISVSIGTVPTGLGWSITRHNDKFADQNDLRTNLEFYHNPDTSRLYLYYKGENPADAFEDIKIVLRGYLLSADAANSVNVTMDNLAVKYVGAHGISLGESQNVTIRNCEIGWIGGSIQTYTFGGRDYPTRFGEGIQNWGSCDGFYIENCYLYQVYDGAASSQLSADPARQQCIMKDIHVTNCLFENNTYSIEMWLGMTAAQNSHGDKFGFEGMRVTDNMFRNMGKGFGNSRPDTAIYEDVADCLRISSGVTSLHVTDCEMTGNIMWGSRLHYLAGGKWNMQDGFRLQGNTFLIEYGSGFGMLPKDFDNNTDAWAIRNYPYTGDTIAALQDKDIIGDNIFYFLAPAEQN